MKGRRHALVESTQQTALSLQARLGSKRWASHLHELIAQALSIDAINVKFSLPQRMQESTQIIDLVPTKQKSSVMRLLGR